MNLRASCIIFFSLFGIGNIAVAQNTRAGITLSIEPGQYCQQWTLLGLPGANLRNPPEIISDSNCQRHPSISGFYTGSCTLQMTAGTYFFFAKGLPRKPAFSLSPDGLVLPLSRLDQKMLLTDLNRLSMQDATPCPTLKGS